MATQAPSDETVPQRYRLTPAQRMRSERDFRLAYSAGSRARGSILVVVVRRTTSEQTRIGLSIGRRIWKSAVKRNFVRRVFREAFRLEQHELPAGIDVVLIAAEASLRPQLAATRRELVYLVRKAVRRFDEKQAESAPREAGP